MGAKNGFRMKLLGRIVSFTAILGITITFSSCFVDYGLNTENYDVVVTYYDSTYSFGTANKYSLIDSVVHLGGEATTRTYDSTIKSQVVSNLAKLGWTRVYDSTANVFVTLGVSSSTYVYGSYDWWSYYGWYPGWGYYPGYGSGWGWYYPYYPTTTYEYTTASLIITMVDPRMGNASNKTVPVEWIAVMNGLLNGSASQERITSNIDQAFTQSPYLKVK